jgi:hypothetical protein
LQHRHPFAEDASIQIDEWVVIVLQTRRWMAIHINGIQAASAMEISSGLMSHELRSDYSTILNQPNKAPVLSHAAFHPAVGAFGGHDVLVQRQAPLMLRVQSPEYK